MRKGVSRVFLSTASLIALITILIGIAIIGEPNWHFTALDVLLDVAAGFAFGIAAAVVSNVLTKNGRYREIVVEVAFVVLGTLAVLTIEGGAASALIFGL